MRVWADRSRLAKDGWRPFVARLVFLFYILLLAEGPLRKWVFPGASNALVFIRDPLMVVILLAYARLGASPPMRRMMMGFAAVLLVFLLCIACQAMTTDVPPLAILAGVRNYFLFVPLCCVVHDSFTRDDYARWLRLNLVVAVPVAALVIVQYRSSPSALVNAAPGGDTDGVFLLVEDIVRPYGLFSFTLGHSAYAAWMIGVALAALSSRRALGLGWPVLASGGAGIAVMGMFSGSRTYILLAATVLLCFLIGSALFGGQDAKKTAAVAALGLALALLAILALDPSLLATMLDRQAAAVASEGSTSERLLRVLTDFWGEMSRVPLFGYGLGSGTNVANYLSNGRTDHVLAEYELTRIIQELGPLFGMAAILLRWSLVAWFTIAALRAVRLHDNLQPLCFLGFVAPIFLAHDVTLQNSMIGIGWFSAGLFFSALRVGPSSRPVMHRVGAISRLGPVGGLV